MSNVGRTPQGVRGLKSGWRRRARRRSWSHPARGAWIEIDISGDPRFRISSHPARGAWIEITRNTLRECLKEVAPRKGCVD